MASNVTLSPLKMALKESLTVPQTIDVKFWVFSKRVKTLKTDPASSDSNVALAAPTGSRVGHPRHVFGIGSILKHQQYFADLLSGGFAETSNTTTFYSPYPTNVLDHTDDYDYDSDSDLGDEIDSESSRDEDNIAMDTSSEVRLPERSFTFEHPGTVGLERDTLGPQCRQVIIKDTAFLTWQALIYYIYTNEVNFVPLRSRNPAQRKALTKLWLSQVPPVNEQPACSPKSMYRLAEKLGLKDLEAKAKKALKGMLSPQIILTEVFSSFTARYPSVMEIEIDYLCANFDNDVVKSQWPTVLKRLLQGDSPHAEEALTILLSKKLAPFSQPQVNPALEAASPQQNSAFGNGGLEHTFAPAKLQTENLGTSLFGSGSSNYRMFGNLQPSAFDNIRPQSSNKRR